MPDPQQAQQAPDLLEQTRQQYPRLRNVPLMYKYNPQPNRGYLEAWPPDEEGDPQYPRPKEFPLDQYGLEVFDPRTRPIDVLGDVVSHFMVNSDPTIKDIYQRFRGSLTSQQKDSLRSQYKWSQGHEKEKRDYQQWLEAAGLPAYFRGRAFQQWPEHETRGWYTPQQLQMFDQMMKYLSSSE